MSCIPANSRLSTLLMQVESDMEEAPSERRGSRTYQIFPEANMDADSDYSSYSKAVLYRRERLPSIVVEPSENSELGSEETQYQTSNNVDKEETSLEGEQQTIERTCSVVARKSSNGPSEGQPSTSRLTPPHSPTHPEAAPPCLQNTSSME